MEPWSQSLEVGQADMDGEHRGLYQQVFAAVEGVEQGALAQVKVALEALFGASEAHFGHEEALMAESAYDGLKVHREAHRAFMADFGRLRGELEARGLSPLFKLWFGSRFQDWLRFHIRGQDFQFYRHLRQWQEAQAQAAEAALMAQARAGAKPEGGPAPPAGPPKASKG